jgi:hypothetical protein
MSLLTVYVALSKEKEKVGQVRSYVYCIKNIMPQQLITNRVAGPLYG